MPRAYGSITRLRNSNSTSTSGALQLTPANSLWMSPGLKLDEMPLEPANTFLLGRTQGSQPPILGYPHGRGSVERLEAWCRQQVAEQDSGQLAMLVLQRHRSAVELDDRVNVWF